MIIFCNHIYMYCDIALILNKKKKKKNLPETVLGSGAFTELVSMLDADQLVGCARAGDGGQEAGGLAGVALSLIIRQQLKGLSLRFLCTLRVQENQLGFVDSVVYQWECIYKPAWDNNGNSLLTRHKFD